MFSGSDVVLIDFGLTDNFVNFEGQHFPEHQEVDEFKGNIGFASVRVLEFKKPSRKDDLMSLAYLLIFLLNNQSMPFNLVDMYKAHEGSEMTPLKELTL
jgi:hypothetical protein